MEPVKMELDSPVDEDHAVAESAHGRNRAAAPHTPPPSTRSTPQRPGAGASSRTEGGGSGRATDSAAPESPGAYPQYGHAEDSDSDLDSDFGAERLGGYPRHGSLPNTADETGKIEHGDFFDSFGHGWHHPS
ncbi:hypothetical protein LPJ61_004944 [Coemansia biformis]|uniref:Uncharacterized protein n=1 Tax=Coemansia biformis TaxID=1286918 RepID=A0A9W7Y9T4_9FUNG|nr:hypothetical protein LPJ61_004944 [Coemansia biformis]